MKMNKKGAEIIQQILVQILIVAALFVLFFAAASMRANSDNAKQQVLEKQLALLIDSAKAETTLTVYKAQMKGTIENIELKNGRIFVYIGNTKITKGYPYFSKYGVEIEGEPDKFLIKIK